MYVCVLQIFPNSFLFFQKKLRDNHFQLLNPYQRGVSVNSLLKPIVLFIFVLLSQEFIS